STSQTRPALRGRGGRMGRWVPSSLLLLAALCLAGVSVACGGGSSTPPLATPATINIVPANNVSLDVGLTQVFTATAINNHNRASAVTISFQSTNPAVVTIANNGLACAGSWDSLTNPIVCTPGPVGTAQITASGGGVSSAPVTVYVHEHIDSITVAP